MDPLARMADDLKEGGFRVTGEAAEAAEVAAPSGPPAFLQRLFQPTSKRPEEFADDVMALGVNKAAGDGAKEAKLGESVALCVDAMSGGATGDAMSSPAAHLGKALFLYQRRRLKAKVHP